MSFEAQLQSILSWAIPRFVESYNTANDAKCRWTGYVPANRAQSVVNPAAFGWDFLNFLGSNVALILELKYARSAGSDPVPLLFNPGQLTALRELEKSVLVRVCFNGKPGLAHRSSVPSADDAQDVLGAMRAVSPTRYELGLDLDKNLLHLIHDLLRCTEGDGEAIATIFKEECARDKSFLDRWHTVGGHIANLLKAGSAPPNLLFFLVERDRLSVLPGESAMLILQFLADAKYAALRKPILKIGNAYLDMLQKDAAMATAIRKIFDEGIEELAKVFNVYARNPDSKEWHDACNSALATFKTLISEPGLSAAFASPDSAGAKISEPRR